MAKGWERLGAQKFILKIKTVLSLVSIFNVSSKRQAIKHSILSSSFKASMTSREMNWCETELRGRDWASISVTVTTFYAILHYMGRQN